MSGREGGREGGGGGGPDTELKTKTPHVNVGNFTCAGATFSQEMMLDRQKLR